jgi:A/G-specific adenine glycosylase
MEFGAMQCKPKNPNCEDCPLQNMCIAFEKKQIDQLPVKLKKTKVRNRFFNYLVVLSSDGKTILNQRTQKGIWQNLYEFPLIETEDVSNEKEIIGTQKFKNYGFENFELSLYNEMPIVHKLSHQHLHTQFWILEIQNDRNSNINWEEIDNYPVPVLIANFLKSFRPNMKSFL